METNWCFAYSGLSPYWKNVKAIFDLKKPISYWEIEGKLGLQEKPICIPRSLAIGSTDLLEKQLPPPVLGLVINHIPPNFGVVHKFLDNNLNMGGFVSFFLLRKLLWDQSDREYWLDIDFTFQPDYTFANLRVLNYHMEPVIY